ncbi:MAG: DNA recombination protein RmuC [Phycisphaerae bacterium]|jgi:DNA recombination protein RmuC|nr:DNA recombination protein RmuC [Phycisphaerae bacterium]
MEYFIGFVIGVLVGAGIALLIGKIYSRTSGKQMQDAFSALAADALDANSKRLSEASGKDLDHKKELIDQTLKNVGQRLEQVNKYLQGVEADRKKEFGALGSSITTLSQTAGQLHAVLASTQRRGAWGERMAEDIIRIAGMIEGVQYTKQSSQQAESGRPDFTFSLPNNLSVNMDVKFPLESYKAYLDADTDQASAAALRALTVAVRGHIRAVAARGYIDTKITTNYVIVFLASEQILSSVLADQPDLIDEALGKRVVLAGPMTLYAMLSVIRQAAEAANLMTTASQVIELLGKFSVQWEKYNVEVDKLGKYIDQANRQFEVITTTRTRALQRPLDRIEKLSQDAGDGDGEE